MATYDELIAKARELAGAGRQEEARRVAEIALRVHGQPAAKEVSESQGFMPWMRKHVLPDDDPTTHNAGETIAAAINKAGEAATFGLIGDEADAAVMTGFGLLGDYDARLADNRAREAVFEEQNPGLSVGSEVGGAVLGAAAAPAAAVGRGAGLGLKSLYSALAGGLGAGTYGFMEGEGGPAERLSGAGVPAAVGTAAGAAFPVAGAGLQRLLNGRAQQKAIGEAARNAPTTDELRAMGRGLYQQIDDAGVQIKPESFSQMQQGLLSKLQSEGLDALPGPGSLTPKSARVMQIAGEMSDEMAEDATSALPFESLDQLRRHAGNAASDVHNRTDSSLGSSVIAGIDEYVQNLAPEDIVAGDVEVLKEVLPKARDVWARMSRSQIIDDAIEASGDYLSGGSSGIRNQFRRILSNKKISRGFSEAEKKLMRRVVSGSIPEQIVHYLGSGLGMLGSTGGGAAIGLAGGPLGMAAGGLMGAAASGVTRRASEAISNRNADLVRRIIANGGMKSLPTAGTAPREVAESLMRRLTAVSQE